MASDEARNIVASIAALPEDPLPQTEPLRAICAADFYMIPTPQIEPLLGALVVRGKRHILAAATGDGKTTMVQHMLRAIVSGTDFAGFTGIGGDVRVLVVDLEQTVDDIQRLLRETELTTSTQIDYVHAPDGIDLNDDTEAGMLEAIIRDGGYAVVVLDPAYKMHAGDSNDEQDTMRLMRRLDEWRSKYGFALMIPMHCRKLPAGVRFTINEVFGSTTWVRGAETILGLQILGEGVSRLHFWKARSGGLPVRAHWDLTFHRDTGFRRKTVMGGDEIGEVLVATIQAAGPDGATMAAMEAAAGKSRDTVERACKRLGFVSERGAHGIKHYHLNDEDERRLAGWDDEPHEVEEED